MRITPIFTLSDDGTKWLKQWARGRTPAVSLPHRARIVLLAAAGERRGQIAEAITMGILGRWRNRVPESHFGWGREGSVAWWPELCCPPKAQERNHPQGDAKEAREPR